MWMLTVHLCTVTIANVQVYTLLETPMWSIFETKCLKLVSFSIIQDFDVDALKCLKFF